MTGFALFWMAMASGAPFGRLSGFGLLFMLFGLPVLYKGLTSAFGGPMRHWLRLRGSHYTLTDRHAFIATEILGRRQLERYPRDAGFRPVLQEGLPGSVWFASRRADGQALMRFDFQKFFNSLDERESRIGFEQIPEARRVFRLMSAPAGDAAAAAAQDTGRPPQP
ncbi:hypothetical protein HOY34_05500 [Xinfangfangia sp. D13-10-4-6]|uniref:hypothetical protein n=1 Tax=Pseudogemmobacter hezensis TaxID=2737662 RepID=UPI0015560894|nr:hypothetical protein [Pseudogemmobacter hezensis]NPD14658.1 hypothetical protein [Pseudogemmobacter hezensis]